MAQFNDDIHDKELEIITAQSKALDLMTASG
jgi:hypothetical protein